MNTRFTLLILVIASFITEGVSGQPLQYDREIYAANYLWPTEASQYLTSTFAETRSQHFHAALDIKTWGRRGYEVYATRDGVIDRIAIGPKGYGKVIYLKHDDGSYSIYAHLLSFNDQLQQLADSVRIAENYQFKLDRHWGWRNIRIKQGEVIGYSGASGIGPPHLHFELRTPSHKPYNPLLTNLSVDDTIAPQIVGIAVEPLSAHSSVEGENNIYRQRAWGKNGQYNLGTIQSTGPIGLAVNVFDQSNRVHNAYAPYKLSLTVDGKQLFTSKADSFSYQETDQMFLDRVYPLLQRDKGGYQRLYIADGNTLPFYQTKTNKGKLNLLPGKHKITIEASDYFGNSSLATMTLNVMPHQKQRPTIQKRGLKTTGATSSVHRWNWFSDWFSITHHALGQITIGADSSQFVAHDNRVAVDLTSKDPLFVNTSQYGPLNLYRTNPKGTTIVSSVDEQAFALFPKHTFYDTVSVGIAVNRIEADSISVDLIPEAYPVRNAYSIYIKRDSALSDTSKLSLYKYDRFDDGDWEMVPTNFTKNYIIAEAEQLGTFVSMRDTTPPQTGNPRLHKRPDKKWVLMIDAIDNLSGIDYENSNISVNGVQGIAEFEPEDDRFVYYRPNFAPSDSMRVQATVCDKMQNCQKSTFHITQ